MDDDIYLGDLNSKNDLDNNLFLNQFIIDDENDLNIFNGILLSSKYFNLKSFSAKCKSENKPVVISLNIQSLQSKFNDLVAFISNLNSKNIFIDVIALQETWAVPYPEAVSIPGYQKIVLNCREISRGGGVGFYVRNNIEFEVQKNLSPFRETIFECLSIRIKFNKKKYILSNVYRSPNPPPNLSNSDAINEFIRELDNLLESISVTGLTSFVTLDDNINLLNDSSISIELMDTLMSNGFLQLITKATRIQGNSISLIDHILTNSLGSANDAGTIINDISDHFINFFFIPTTSVQEKPSFTNKRVMSRANKERFKECLTNLSWRNVTNNNNVDEAFDLFWNDFKNFYDLCFPLTRSKFNKNIHAKQPFMTKGLLISRTKKAELHKIYLINPTVVNKSKYTLYRNLYSTIVRTSKKLYYESSFQKCRKNSKKTWDLIREVTFGHEVKKSSIEKITVNNTEINDPQQIADEFNNFFTEIGSKISNSIQPTITQPENYLRDVPNLRQLDLGQTGPVHFCDILKSFEPKKSQDIDGISIELLKFISTSISTPLSHIFNLSLSTGTFPNKLKISRTVPIHKCGRADLCDNYRPISLLSTLSKILEKIVSIQLVNHLELNKLIYKHQYGFQRNKSTEHHLIHLSNFVSNAINENKYCIGVFLDLKKAFDVCSHPILIKKLKKLGISGTPLKWFKSYLSDRKQRVEVNGKTSSTKDISISVLQGSILGPILFLCYINDLPGSTLLYTLLFADDTACLAAGNSLPDLINYINTELNKMAIWFRANKMAVNAEKTKYIIFHAKNKKVDPGNTVLVFDNNEPGQPYNDDIVTPLLRIQSNHPDESQQAYKLLGIWLDENLSLEQHVKKLCSKLTRALFFLRRAQNFLTDKALRSLYYAIFHSHLLYCPIILSSTAAKNIKRIQILQKKAIRVISREKNLTHTRPLFAKLKILPYDLLVQQSKLSFMHSIKFNYAPESFADVWLLNANREHEYQLRNNNDFIIPAPRIEFFRKQPIYTLPFEWNKLEDSRFQTNRITFQIELKNNLLEQLNDE